MKTTTLQQHLAKHHTPEEVAEIYSWVDREKTKIALREMRKLLGLTQAELAKRVGVSQGQLSETEGREDWLLSTVRSYVEALGGELEVRAVFGDRSLRLHLRPPHKPVPKAKPRRQNLPSSSSSKRTRRAATKKSQPRSRAE